jgi:hypothetical protein
MARTKTYYICDGCDHECPDDGRDIYEHGWIKVDGTNGKLSLYHSKPVGECQVHGTELGSFFCSPLCLIRHIRKVAKWVDINMKE